MQILISHKKNEFPRTKVPAKMYSTGEIIQKRKHHLQNLDAIYFKRLFLVQKQNLRYIHVRQMVAKILAH